MKSSFRSLAPLIPSGGSLADALAFYTGAHRFSIVWQGGGMAGIERDGIAFNLVENENWEWADNASFSIGVPDLDALCEEYRHIPANVGPRKMKFWGRREFHMIVPSGVCLQFYQQGEVWPSPLPGCTWVGACFLWKYSTVWRCLGDRWLGYLNR